MNYEMRVLVLQVEYQGMLQVGTLLRNFKNTTFYFDCFLYWVDLMLFPIQYFILSRDKPQLTIKRILLRPFILTLL